MSDMYKVQLREEIADLKAKLTAEHVKSTKLVLLLKAIVACMDVNGFIKKEYALYGDMKNALVEYEEVK